MNTLLIQLGMGNAAFAFGELAFVFVIAQLAVNVACAVGVANACQKLEANGREPVMVPRLVWIVATFFTGLFGVLIYWAMHHSTLSREP
ncbi:MAG: hypothetical protein O3A95_06810 [Planctomycetota bacterium]|nr:hypothetical protein [Planctomycetota bacterium]MDA1113993.1 hypothetical protein [Planctomycetota bacterium]